MEENHEEMIEEVISDQNPCDIPLYCLVHRDPYFMAYEIITIYNWVGCHPLYNPTNRGPLDHCSSLDLGVEQNLTCRLDVERKQTTDKGCCLEVVWKSLTEQGLSLQIVHHPLPNHWSLDNENDENS